MKSKESKSFVFESRMTVCDGESLTQQDMCMSIKEMYERAMRGERIPEFNNVVYDEVEDIDNLSSADRLDSDMVDYELELNQAITNVHEQTKSARERDIKPGAAAPNTKNADNQENANEQSEDK